MESWMTDLIVQVIAGALGGTAAGSVLKDLSLGKGAMQSPAPSAAVWWDKS